MSANELFNDGPLTLDEQMKIISLMENPPEGAAVRKALRFYEVPDGLVCNWGNIGFAMKLMKHFASPQNPEELAWMLEYVKSASSLLEIGSSFGGTLKSMASVMPVGSRIVSVDLPCDATPAFLNPLATLKDTCRKIGLQGGNVELIVGDSHLPAVVEKVRSLGPFDFCFIDGDHSYEGVKADWENYGPMAKVVGFHDIGGPVEDCERFWRELKASTPYRTAEIISMSTENRFGIGIVFREE